MLHVEKPVVKASLAPGSRVVTEYLAKSGLQPYLDQLGFNLVGYGCATCMGNSGPLDPHIEEVVVKNDLIAASVLSGNRNFEARVHQNVKANFLMSPPLVVAFALAGRVDIDLTHDAIGKDPDGRDVFLKDLWPSSEEVRGLLHSSFDADTFRTPIQRFRGAEPDVERGAPPASATYVRVGRALHLHPGAALLHRFFSLHPGKVADIRNARPLAIFGDSVTTDHISPAGAIKPASPAGHYLQEKGVGIADFNSYGSRRGNDRVMTRGTFANVRIKNLMAPGTEGGVTLHQPDGEQLSIFDAAVNYHAANQPLVVIAGSEYGTGSSRDWAAKGTNLLGVRAVVASSFERIHRSNLVGMGVLPLQFKEGVNASTLGLVGTETFDILGLDSLKPQQDVALVVHRASGETVEVPVTLRIDTPIEIDYYQHGGILPYVLRQLISESKS